MKFRRIDNLPPYVFAEINQRSLEARRSGVDVIDLGFGNPDIPSPPEVVDKLVEAARNPKNHAYSASRGLPNLRKAVADRYLRRHGVELDPETEVINTIGAKEGLSHLCGPSSSPAMWRLCRNPPIRSTSMPRCSQAPTCGGSTCRPEPTSSNG